MTPELRDLVIEGRRRQGLPDRIEDPATLARIAGILLQQASPAAETGEAA